MLIKETSERSKNDNLIEKHIDTLSRITQLDFEGASTNSDYVTCLVDRGLTNQPLSRKMSSIELYDLIIKSEPNWFLKQEFAKKLNVPWFYVIYNYSEEHCIVVNLSVCTEESLYFNSFEEFGKWFSRFADTGERFSSYQESGLPQFDVALRNGGHPWPGNIDGILYDNASKQFISIIEYQNTSKKPVAQHDNNDFMQTTPYRKGDGKRWRTHYLLTKQRNLPVLVIVWSRFEKVTNLKRIQSFDLDEKGYVSHINWGKNTLVPIESVTGEMLIDLMK